MEAIYAPRWMSEVHDDRYRAASGSVLQLEHSGHTLHVTSTDGGWAVDVDGARQEAATAEELADLLAAAAPLWRDPEPRGPRSPGTTVAVTTSLDRGMASDLLFWMTHLGLIPIVNGVVYDSEIGGAPANLEDCTELGGIGWELPDGGSSPSASYGTVWLKRVGSRVFQDDPDTGFYELGFWNHNDEDFINRVTDQLYEAGVYDYEDEEDEEEYEDDEDDEDDEEVGDGEAADSDR